MSNFTSFEFSAEKFNTHWHANSCDLCFHNAADWSDLTETELSELVLTNLDTIFKIAIKRIVASGYSEGIATTAILRSGLWYGCKYTVSKVVDNTLEFLISEQEIDSHYFDNLQQMDKYILAELVCLLRESRWLRAAELAASCRDVSRLVWARERLLQAKDIRDEIEAKLNEEWKAKNELLTQATSFKKEREQVEISTQSKEDTIKSRAQTNLHEKQGMKDCPSCRSPIQRRVSIRYARS
ncbi:RING/U-box superfamily protein [Striga asiatica]|uniref:RING/U-box superfamily protein n=1 Tax=Striga asiatica TaxID=4170 RepID=A0A5A7QXQ8_STRAF|nr:RING/U-box superfamily protein [Striga asiatica]